MQWLLCLFLAEGFYLPGVMPKNYKQDDKVELYVNKLDSSETQLPFDYYYLGFCKPKHPNQQSENLGQYLSGDSMESSLYKISMNKFTSCETLCETSQNNEKQNNMKWMILNQYRAQWVVDNLPSGLRKTVFQYNRFQKLSYYQDGFPIGFIEGGKPFINNHAHIILKIYPLPSSPDNPQEWRIVGFLVEPFSIQGTEDGKAGCNDNRFLEFIDLMNNQATEEIIMIPEEIVDRPAEFKVEGIRPQGLDKKIFFSYSTSFEESDTEWASRWDMYLYMQGDNTEVHWLSIINSFAMVLFLSGMVAHILSRTLKRDISNYNERADLEGGDETGWKQVHGDVFRRPHMSGLFSIIIGSGVQIIVMFLVTLIFACLGFLSPAHRGALLTTMLLLYAFMGVFAGYISARLFKLFGNIGWKKNAIGTALLVPACSFSVFFVINICILAEESSGAVPFKTLLSLLILWLGISLPLVLLGSAIGFRKEPIKNPCEIHRIPRMIQVLPGAKRLQIICFMAGSLPFGCMFIELSYVMKSMWHHNLFYYLFGFLFLCFIVLIITSAEVSILMTYILLCREDYRWWWLSFGVSGSSGVYMFAYAIIYFLTELQFTRFSSLVLYFGYMLLISLLYTLVTGTVGFIATFVFIRTIYSLIKVQ